MLRIEMNAEVSGLRIMPSTAEFLDTVCLRAYLTFSICLVVTPGRSWSICGAKISCIERDCVQQDHSSGHFADGLQLLCCFIFFSLSFKLYSFHAAVYYTYSVNKCHISVNTKFCKKDFVKSKLCWDFFTISLNAKTP